MRSNRSQAAVFVVLTFAISWTEQFFIIRGQGIQNPVRAFCLMWTPGLVGLACGSLFDKNWSAVALRRPSWSALAIAYGVPAFTAACMVSLLAAFSIAQFQVSPALVEKKGGLGNALVAALLLAPTVGMIIAFVSALGEELGWRGFLHSKLLHLSAGQRYLLTGAIWSVWHWPLILFGDYATSDRPWVNVIFFSVAVASLSFLLGWLRDRSRSSVPAALAHASHNMWVLGIAPAFFTKGPLVPYFGGESGLFCALLYVGVAGIICWRLRAAFSPRAGGIELFPVGRNKSST